MEKDKVFDAEFYKKINTIRMSMKMKLAAGMNGGRKSNAKGTSVEFSDFREYILGDDIRRIDWNAYGRFDKLFVKLFMEEKEGIFRVFVDSSKSMDFGNENKAVCAERIAGALSYCVLDNADRLYLNVIGNSLTEYKGVTGRQAFHTTLERLAAIEFNGTGSLYETVRRANVKQRGVSIIISDFFTDDLEDILKFLTFNKQEVILIQVLAREEVQPEYEGTINLIDSETSGNMRVTMGTMALDKEYKANYNRFINEIDALARKYRANYIRTISDESIDSVLFNMR
ncbi:MAG: DUF58 domain-containing protein [Lachnospiraceae bacterium]|nr:DUF58 domain-containing protein [Lachnospiraceae bacterium]